MTQASTPCLPGSSRGNRDHSVGAPPTSCHNSPPNLTPTPSVPAADHFRDPAPFPLVHGGELPELCLAYELSGPFGAPLVVAQGGISASYHVVETSRDPSPGWWQALVGAGRAVDPAQVRVLSFDYLGGNGGSSCSWDRSEPATADDPVAIDPRDQALALVRLLDHLGEPRIDLFLGASYGGMVALALATEHPERLGRAVVVGAADRAHPRSTAWRTVQRRIVQLATRQGASREGLALSRALAMTTYRSADELEQRFGGRARREDDGRLRFPVEGYLDARGDDFARRFDPRAFLTLSQSIDLHRIDPSRGWCARHIGRGHQRPVGADRTTPTVGGGSRGAGPVGRDRVDLRARCFLEGRSDDRDGRALRAAGGRAGVMSTQSISPRQSTKTSAATRAVRSGLESDAHHGAVVPPIHLSSNFTFEDFGKPRKYDYTRSGNPTRDLLAEALTEAEGGAGGVVTTTGMAAVHLALQLVPAGGRVLAPSDCYGGSHRLLSALHRRGDLVVDFCDLYDHQALEAGLAREPALVWVETPSNPLLRITDLDAVVRGAAAVGARVVVDNTFLSPVLQRPLDLGADLVVHSTTKYLNGHSDVVGGVVIAATDELADELRWWGNCLGLTGSPFDAYLTLRGLRTLHVRMAQHQRNAQALADKLATHGAVSPGLLPGARGAPGARARQAAAVGFWRHVELRARRWRSRGSSLPRRAELFLTRRIPWWRRELDRPPGDHDPCRMDAEARRAAGIGDTLLRISAGIEDTGDLLEDLTAALDRAQSASVGISGPPVVAAGVSAVLDRNSAPGCVG